LLNAAFAMAIQDLISQVHLPSSVNMLPKYLKRFTFSSCLRSLFIVTGVGCLEILITFVFFHIHGDRYYHLKIQRQLYRTHTCI
jgi:hypothetical protein